MVRIGTCYFCSSPIYPGHGINFARNDCKVFSFCRSKCHKNFNQKRNPRKAAWTKVYRKTRGKEMAVDTTFEFEKRRNRPVKYDRNLVGATLRAMQRVGEIQQRRAALHFKARMAEHRASARERARVEIKQNIELLAPAAAVRETAIANALDRSARKVAARQPRDAAARMEEA